MSAATVLMLAAAGLAGLVMIGSSPVVRLCIASALAIPQIYLPGLPLPIAQWWLLAIFVAAVLGPRPKGRVAGVATLFGLAGAYVLSLLWSIDRAEGVGYVLRILMFVGVLLTVRIALERDEAWFAKVMRWASPVVVTQALLVLVFRLQPALEAAFFQSGVSRIFVGPEGQGQSFSDLGNNIVDPDKAGGFFVNANVASMALGVAMLLFFAVWVRKRSRVHLVVAGLCLVAVWATGSKTGLALSVATPVLAVLLRTSRERVDSGRFGLVLTLLAPAVLGSSYLLADRLAELQDASGVSFGERERIWSLAHLLFNQHPLLGLGFGGWYSETSSVLQGLPPHNIFVAAWASSGLLAVVLTFTFIVVVTRAAWMTLDRRRSDSRLAAYAACAAAWVWVIAHGMGDNTAIFGDSRSMVMVGVALGLLTYGGSVDAEESVTRSRPASSPRPGAA